MYKQTSFSLAPWALSFYTLLCGCLSPWNASTQNQVGVLVLAHGSSKPEWNEAVVQATEPLRKTYPVQIAFGMANPHTMQPALDRLEANGVDTIVVVPLFISSHSPIIRQTEYLLGLRDSLADPPMQMHHGTMGRKHHNADPDPSMGLQPLDFQAQIVMTQALDDHPVVARILHERILEMSTDPAKETVLIVAHGPNDEADNRMWVQTMDRLADQVRQLQMQSGATAFKQIFCLTVRDDADRPIYEQAKAHLRSLVYQAGKDGEVIVVPLLLASGGIEAGYVERLQGLKYRWTGKTLLPHPLISRFLEESVRTALQHRTGS